MDRSAGLQKWIVFTTSGFGAGVLLIVLGIVLAYSEFDAYRPTLTTDKSVTIMEGHNEIYYEYYGESDLEDPPIFTFTNRQTREETRSTFPKYYTNYSSGGLHGQLVAIVALPEGSYFVDFDEERFIGKTFVITSGYSMHRGMSAGFLILGGIVVFQLGFVGIVLYKVKKNAMSRPPMPYPYPYPPNMPYYDGPPAEPPPHDNERTEHP